MTNIVDFPEIVPIPDALPRKRVFYVGYRYVGPMLCQDVQNLYLKRKSVKNGKRWWAIITYTILDEYSSKTFSFELEECSEDNVPDMLERFELEDEVSISDLRKMGWRGKVQQSATIVRLSAEQGDLFTEGR